jgi:Na+/melibiose symporter-like transporter
MMAEVAKVDRLASGTNRDGTHAAGFSVTMQLGFSLGMLSSGWFISLTGFVAGAAQQTPETAWRLAAVSFIGVPGIVLLSLLPIRKYRAPREYVEREPNGAPADDAR